jgi:hypothetical protein
MLNSVQTQSGATLLEVVVSTFLLSVSVTGLSSLYGQSAYVLTQARHYQAAIVLSADYWELTQAIGLLQPRPMRVAADTCEPLQLWLDGDVFEQWQQRWGCLLPQAQVALLVSADRFALAWQGLHPSAAVDMIMGVQ